MMSKSSYVRELFKKVFNGFNVVVFDAETDDLVATVLHVVSVCPISIGKSGPFEVYSTKDISKLKRLFSKRDTIFVGHNIIRFDIPQVCEKFLGFKPRYIFDTMVASWYLEPDRKIHGLDSYGKEFGIEKPKIDDWVSGTYEDYKHRCQEDVKINVALLIHQVSQLWAMYKDADKINELMEYLQFKAKCAEEQERYKWKLDVQVCESSLNTMEIEKNKRYDEMSVVMPKVPKYADRKPPAKPFKKDGTMSASGQKWKDLTEQMGLPFEHDEPIRVIAKYEEPNPGSTQQMKKWLFSEGWKPCTFNFVKDDTIEGGFRKVPQILDKSSKKVTPSVKKLYEKIPELAILDGLTVINHRIGVLKGFMKNVDKDGYVKASVQGFTNTLRFKHRVVVNLPGVTGKNDWRDGVHVRECLTADEGTILLGSDMSSLEDRTKQHYMWDYDPNYVKTMLDADFDPHLDIAVIAYNMGVEKASMSQEDSDWFKKTKREQKIREKALLRGEECHIPELTEEEYKHNKKLSMIRADAKQINYSCVYGAGGKSVARSLKVPQEIGFKLVEAYRLRNKAVKEIARDQQVITVGDKMWLVNPVNGFLYSLRHEKDIFSTLNQGTGVYCFDMWIKYFLIERKKICKDLDIKDISDIFVLIGQMHDEVILRLPDNEEAKELASSMLKRAITKTNNKLKLNRDLDIDIQFGVNYAKIH